MEFRSGCAKKSESDDSKNWSEVLTLSGGGSLRRVRLQALAASLIIKSGRVTREGMY